MEITVLAVLPFMVGLSFSALATLAWRQSGRKAVRRTLTAYLTLMAVWSFGSSLLHGDATPGHALWWTRLAFAAGLFSSVLYYHFVRAYLGRSGLDGWLRLGYLLAPPLLLYVFLGDVVLDAQTVEGASRVKFGPGRDPASLYTLLFYGLVAYTLVARRRRSRDLAVRTRLTYLLIGYSVVLLSGFTNFDAALAQYPLDQIGNLVNALIITFVVLRHDLLETTVLIRRGVLYALLTAIFTAFYLGAVLAAVTLLHGSFDPPEVAGSFALALLVGLAFQPLRERSQRWIDRVFFREEYDYRLLLREWSQRMAGSLELVALCSSLLDLIDRAMHVGELGLLVLDEKEQGYRLVAGDQGYQESLKLGRDHPVVQAMERSNTPLTREDILALPRFLSLWQAEREQLRGVDFELLVPLVANQLLVGILVLGRRRSEQPYTVEDVSLLSTVGNQAAVAIDKARLYEALKTSYQELLATQEKLVQAGRLSALGEMAAGIAHDFNNMLTVVLGMSQLALERPNLVNPRKALENVLRAAEDGCQMVRRLQYVAARRAQEEELPPTDLNEVARTALEITRPRWYDEAQRRGATVEAVLDLGELPLVAANAAEIREALTNLIFNAVDALPQGGQIRITTRVTEGTISIAVADTGTGMTEETKRRCTEPFFTSKGAGGTGLGLSVVQGIMVRHRGHVQVDSELGQGTTISLCLPVTIGAGGKLESAPGPAREARILVIDDQEGVAEILALMLENDGHQVATAAGGREGLDTLKAGPFDLVFADLGMPGMNGWEVARAVKTLNPDMPVALVTGWGAHLDEDQLRQNGVDLVLSKPYRIEDVRHLLARALGGTGNGGTGNGE